MILEKALNKAKSVPSIQYYFILQFYEPQIQNLERGQGSCTHVEVAFLHVCYLLYACVCIIKLK